MRKAGEKKTGAMLSRFVEALNCWDINAFKEALADYRDDKSESELSTVLTQRDYVRVLSSDDLFYPKKKVTRGQEHDINCRVSDAMYQLIRCG